MLKIHGSDLLRVITIVILNIAAEVFGFSTNDSIQSAVYFCGGEQSGTRGITESPYYPSNYPNNANCTWKISILDSDKIYFEFSHFELDFNCYDYVEITTDNGTLIKMCHPHDLGTVFSVGATEAHVKFVSDSSINYSGFSLEWRGDSDSDDKRKSADYIIGRLIAGLFLLLLVLVPVLRFICACVWPSNNQAATTTQEDRRNSTTPNNTSLTANNQESGALIPTNRNRQNDRDRRTNRNYINRQNHHINSNSFETTPVPPPSYTGLPPSYQEATENPSRFPQFKDTIT